ncbi:MAG: hypothetical protein KC643_19565, partial [Nitrospira sp.]|nr:hypothetical protein [Nitrospira sp.]
MSATNFLEKVSLEIGQAFLPLRQTVKAGVSDSAFEELFQELGWELRSFLSEEEIKRIRNAVESATEFLDHSNDLSKLVSGLPDLVETFETLFNPSELQFESADFKNSFSELGLRLLDALVISHLQRRFPITHNLLVFLGIIHIRYVPSTESISSHITWDFDWDNLQRIFSEPEKVFRDQRTYHWGHADFDARKLFVNLRNVLWLYGIPVGIQSRDQDSIRVLSPDSTSDPILRIPALTKVQEGIIQQAGASLIPYRATAGEGYAGIALVIFGLAQLEKDFTLGKHWIGTVRGQAEALSTQGIVWDFQKGLSLSPLPGEGFRPPNFEIFVALIKKSEADSKDILFGSPTGSNLSVGTFGFRGGVELKANSISEIFLETFIEQASLKITAGSDDAFLKKALPNGVVIPFDLIVGSSTDRGLYFGGSAGLSVKFPIRKTLGPLCVHAITLKAHIGEEAKLNAVAAISFSLKLGPATVSLDEVGLDFGVLISRRPSFSVNPYGPSGGGISIKAAGVTGGGYLSFDKANHLYSGALQLQFAKVGLDAIGFITTGGPEGFSLVININTRFTPPVQLSFGFMLVAVGGLIAINRTLSVEALQAGMLDGTLDSLLFPPNPVAQAPRIIQDLQRVLPAQDGRYVVGPMLRLTWGAKSLVKIDLGLFFELPNPLRMLLAGQLDVAVPHEDKALIKFQAAILGLLDLGRKVLAIDTRIKEGSHIVGFEVLGDTALRLSWGE